MVYLIIMINIFLRRKITTFTVLPIIYILTKNYLFMKKTILLFALIIMCSCSSDQLIETTYEANEFEQINLNQSKDVKGLQMPSYCNISASNVFGGFEFSFNDQAAWGSFIHIRPLDCNNDRGIGKMYTISESTGIVVVPTSHGIYCNSSDSNNHYAFTVEEMQTPSGTVVTSCDLGFLFN